MVLPIAAIAPALAVQRRGLLKAPSGQKRRKTCCIEFLSTRDIDVSLDEGIWKMLSEDIIDLILERLPFAAKCNLWCLCRQWKVIQLLSPPPPVTIMSKAGDQNAVFCCNAEWKWISMPSNGHLPSASTWELVDADGGLVCYQGKFDLWFWFWVCNPLKPSLSRLIPPNYPVQDPKLFIPQPPTIKLLMDRASRTYKIIATADQLPCTSVYNSTTSRWDTVERCPQMFSMDYFVWQNMLYTYNTQRFGVQFLVECLSLADKVVAFLGGKISF